MTAYAPISPDSVALRPPNPTARIGDETVELDLAEWSVWLRETFAGLGQQIPKPADRCWRCHRILAEVFVRDGMTFGRVCVEKWDPGQTLQIAARSAAAR